MFLFEVGGGKFGDVNSLLQLFICVRSKLEDISILVLLCLNTYTTKSCECRAGRVFSGPARYHLNQRVCFIVTYFMST